ncbi:sirohydrochlorin cobaltochelatase, partial [Desulfovibrio sp. OttesenSCG-928-C06]|nr:sirohydrochlorin cobaltochelatase [Desulfovibrio sp. OttesenSCG-928-C06]
MKFRLLLIALAMAFVCGCSAAHDQNIYREEQTAVTQVQAQQNKALMLTVFGTSTEASITFDELLPMVKARFPGYDIFTPYTSGIIREKLNAEISNPADLKLSPQEMLVKLKDEGYTEIRVVSTILFPGIEHEKIAGAVSEFATANPDIAISYAQPFMSAPENMQAAVAALGKYVVHDAANIVVAHGTHEGHPAEKHYKMLAELITNAYPNARMASVEGLPDLDEALDWAAKYPARDVNFIVCMFVAGDHAQNDIASDDDDSMFSAVLKMGKEPSVPFVNTSAGK